MTSGQKNLPGLTTPAIRRRTATSASQPRSRERYIASMALVLLDSLAISTAFGFAYLVRFKSEWSIFYRHTEEPLGFYSTLVFWLIPLILVVFAFYHLYTLSRLFDDLSEYSRIASASTLSLLLVTLVSFFFDDDLVISRGWLLISWVALIVFVSLFRFGARQSVYRLRGRGYLTRRVGIVAGQDDATQLASWFGSHPGCGMQVVSILDPASLVAGGDQTYLQEAIRANDVEEIVVSSASVSQSVLEMIVRDLAQRPTALRVVPGTYEIQTTEVQVQAVRGLPLITMNKVRITGIDYLFKRALDYTIAIVAIIVLAPVLLALTIAVRIGSPGPVFHRRRVLGERGQQFDAYKFRTMYVNGDEILAGRADLEDELRRTGKLVDDPRITPLGGWMRRWSLDEFPQLFNVLRGQMSIVGPRMITVNELEHFGHWRDNLITVKPGLTGLWQVSGRSNLGYDERVRLDMYYIRSYSIWTDLEIVLRTIPTVIRGEGAY